MRLVVLAFLLIGILLPTDAQRRKKTTTPSATSSEIRWQGYQKRLTLQENSLVKNVKFRNVGPTIMSGRVVDFAVDPNNPAHFYVAYASGSLWETFNHGTSFIPIFDNQIVMTIGDIAVDWKTNTLYVGTGENNSSRSSYSGYGIYKSSNNGETWEHLGLEETHHTGRIILHPNDPNTIWVAALGHLYSENEERGVYKSTDGGKTWKKTLFVNNRTGIVDLVIHPENPDVLIAAAWEKDRKAWNFVEAGDGTGIYRSEDGGNTWKPIGPATGFPDTKGTGRIGLAYAPSNPSIVYAMLDNQDRRKAEDKEVEGITKDQLRSMSKEAFLSLENKTINAYLDDFNFPSKYNAVDLKRDIRRDKIKPVDLVTFTEDANSLLFDTPVKGGEMYRSDDGGKTWKKTHTDYIENLVYSYGYYFGQVRVDPQNPDLIYTMGVPIIKSEDAGKTWMSINQSNVHADHHALWINPSNGKHLILGNDGGVNISFDGGDTWLSCNSPSVGQFYSVNVDMAEPYNVYGGLQDNGVWKGPSNYSYSRRWLASGNYPYTRLMGGDGMQVQIDSRDNNTVYTGYQFGNYFRVDANSGKRTRITPIHELGEAPYRWNWESPILISSHNQDIIYFGSNRFHRSMDKGDNFKTLSGDLTKGGKKGDVSFGTLTTISESPERFGLIYVGSDDGLIHITRNGGQDWELISSSLPQDFWVSQVWASPHKEGRVYVSLNGYRWDNFEPMVFVSDNYGKSWRNISGGLPNEPVNVVKDDPVNENIVYVGTDHGVYVSLDGGSTYQAFMNNLVNAPVHDLVVHPRENDLVLGTHGRGIYVGDISLVQQLKDHILAKELHLFPIEDMRFSSRWGSGWTWGNVSVPQLEVSFYSGTSGSGKMEILFGDEVVMSTGIVADKGLNIQMLDLEFDESFTELAGEGYQAGEDGKFYPAAGDYTVRVSVGSRYQSTSFEVKAPRQRAKRKE